MRKSGEITVFLAMILVSVCALLCGLAESVRTAGADCYLRMAADSAVDSLMAQYHRKLWRKYRILGLECEGQDMLEREMEEFLFPYMDAVNWYPMKISGVEAADITMLTDGDGRYLEQEILDYMKYGLIDTKWDEMDEGGAGELLTAWREGGGVNRISELYSSHTKEAVQLEKALENIDSRLTSQKQYWNQGMQCLENMDGSGFISKADKMIKELNKLPGLVDIYEKRADRLAGKLTESRRRFEEEGTDISPEVRQALEEEITQYESYAAQDGQRRKEVVLLRESGPERIKWIEDVISMAEDVMEYIDDWEPEDEDDELDEDALWSPVREQWSRYGMLSLGIGFGIKDKEREGFLEQIGRMASGGLLELVLPPGSVVSGQKLGVGSVPSADWKKGSTGGQGNQLKGGKNLLYRLLVGEYDIRFFEGFKKEMQNGSFYELEYIVHGKGQDRDNLSGVIARLVGLREGMNLIHILSDPDKRQEAQELALAIVGGTGILPLVSVTAFFIMSVWALGEALVDVRTLLDGKRVPLLKSKDDWKLGLDGLLDIGRNKSLGERETEGNSTDGLTYKGYMRILIFGGYGAGMIYRMMDVMQMNIAKEQAGFSMKHCACSVDTVASVSGKHVFFSVGLWKNQMGDSGFKYETRMAASGSYLDDSEY